VAFSNGAQTPDTAGHGTPVELGCPECAGGMFEFRTGRTVYFRCHKGHAWSPETLLDAERDSAESGALRGRREAA
jgi:two-component system chemotaxis response regulator CheB